MYVNLYSLVNFLSTQIMVVEGLLSGIAVYMGRGQREQNLSQSTEVHAKSKQTRVRLCIG